MNFDKNFEVIVLGQVITSMKSGFAAGKANQGSSECGIVQIRPTNIDTTGTLIFDKNVYIDSEIVKKKPEQVLSVGEVLFNNTNSQEWVGKTTYFDKAGDFVCSNHITRIVPDSEKLLPRFLTILLFYQEKRIFLIFAQIGITNRVNAKQLEKPKSPPPRNPTTNHRHYG